MGGKVAILLLVLFATETICSKARRASSVEDGDGGNESKAKNDLDSGVASSKRALTVGDIFTPPDLMPVAEKLISKVRDPGLGKGVVSSAKSPGHLAETLFQRFFLTNKRIVVLNTLDITGLDALQALALSGEDAYLRTHVKDAPNDIKTVKYLGQNIGVHTDPKKSKFLLLSKNEKTNNSKKLAIRKHVPVKHRTRHSHKHNVKAQRSNSNSQRKNGRIPTPPKSENKKPPCTWKYVCSVPSDLDTCKVVTECRSKTKKYALNEIDSLGIPHRPDEHSPEIQQFRKMLGLTLVDEEVEKILETRVLALKPDGNDSDFAKLESLSKYFNSIVLAEHLETTSPFARDVDWNQEVTEPDVPDPATDTSI